MSLPRMKPRSIVLVCVALVCAGMMRPSGIASASPVVLDFDDVATSPTYPAYSAPMPTGYGGLTWENFYVVNGYYPPLYGTGYKYGMVTPPNTAYNGYATPATISTTTRFDFVEASFAVAYSQTDDPSQIQIDGYLGNELKYTTQLYVVETGPSLATLDYNGIDRLVFTSLVNPHDGRRSQFVMDNFTFRAHRRVWLPCLLKASY